MFLLLPFLPLCFFFAMGSMKILWLLVVCFLVVSSVFAEEAHSEVVELNDENFDIVTAEKTGYATADWFIQV